MLETIWQEFLKIVNQEAGSRVVETWFKAVCMIRWDSNAKIVYLKAPNPFVKDWLSSKYMGLFQRHLSRLLNEDYVKVILTIDISETSIALVPKIEEKNLINPAKPAGVSIYPTDRKYSTDITDYQFSNFIVGPNNQLAYSAAHAITENPGKLYNPLFIYGGSGLGKTHLLRAISFDIKKKFQNSRVLYQSADKFVNEFIGAIRFDKMRLFEAKYKNVDVLLVDDVQFISKKEQTQEAFFHIFNSLHESGKQIVFSSDAMPSDIAGLANRLRSRLEGGLVVDIQMPPLETRIAILKKKAEKHSVALTDDIAAYIAFKDSSNIRELEGLLIRVIAFASLTQKEIDLDLAKQVLGNIKEHRSVANSADMQIIAQTVARYYHCSLQELRSSKRAKTLSLARHVSMYFMKKMTDKSLRDIGLFWCRKDHTTVLHAVEKIEQIKVKDNSLFKDLKNLEQELCSSL